VTTANEILVPVGERVKLTMTSGDVIHSFWVPNLAGKKDIVPGYRTETWILADRPGVYRGQCAEFCGHQHAKMALTVVAVPRDAFNQWVAGQLQPAAAPTDSLALAGQQVFVKGPCALCHNITGTSASGVVAPDLTHLASRRMIAAGTLPNRRGQLAGWIVDPQGIKPGVRMPSNQLDPNELRALLAYLEGLR
jgi:cytochrome c oxidase subunit II